MIKKVVLLGIDSLGIDRLVSGGYPYELAPTITKLSKNNLFCPNTYTHSGPTQLALPSVFSSVMPLDKGGYNGGITGKPKSVVKILEENNFVTKGILADGWNSELGGYHVGFKQYIRGFDICLLWNLVDRYVRFYSPLIKSGDITKKEYIDILKPYYERTFLASISHANAFSRQSISKTDIKDTYFGFAHYDYEVLENIFTTEQGLYRENPDEYVYRTRFVSRMFNHFLDKNSSALGRLINKFRHHKSSKPLLFNKVLPAEKCIDWMLKNINPEKGTKEFYWAFLADIHEKNFSASRSYFKNGKLNSFLERSGIKKKVTWGKIFNRFKYENEHYEASIRYIDDQVKILVDHLEEHNLSEETLLVLFADHGVDVHREYGFGSFEDAYLKVPLIFIHPSLKQQTIEANCATSDIAPTICHILGIDPDPDYLGKSVLSKGLEDRVIFHENMGGGPFDLKFKNIKIKARKTTETMFCEFDRQGNIIKTEYKNSISCSKNQSESLLFEEVQNRYAKIRAFED